MSWAARQCSTALESPVQTFIDYIEGGDNLDSFLEDFPTVSRHQIIEILELIKNKLIDAVA